MALFSMTNSETAGVNGVWPSLALSRCETQSK